MFEHTNKSIAPDKIRALMGARKYDMDITLAQLVDIDFLTYDKSDPTKLRYNKDSTNTELQVDFEKFMLLDASEMRNFHRHVDYSPTCR